MIYLRRYRRESSSMCFVTIQLNNKLFFKYLFIFSSSSSNTFDSNNWNSIPIQLQVTVNLNYKTMTSIHFIFNKWPQSICNSLDCNQCASINWIKSFSIIVILSPLLKVKHTQLRKFIWPEIFRKSSVNKWWSLILKCVVHLCL